MKLRFLGAAETVTGSKTLLSYADQNILIDCGLFQGPKHLRQRNWKPFPFPPGDINAVVLTHAHIDHSGYLPLLVKQGFQGPIYCTDASKDLCEILLRDSARIHEEDARRANKYGYSRHKPALPLYTEVEAEEALKQLKVVERGQDIPLGDDLTFHMSRAGHILGSSIVTFRNDVTSIVFSGDLGRPHAAIMKSPATIQTADYLVLESTYGNRLHGDEDTLGKLAEIITSTSRKGGTVIIPSFAVGRTQMVLWLIHQLRKDNRIPDIPIYLDSPMAQDATDIFRHHHSEHRLSDKETEEVCRTAHYVRNVEESKALNSLHMPAVIISASGMVEGGRVLHHIKHRGPDPRSSIVFAGFQAPMTRGDRILNGEAEVKIHGKEVPIRARVERLEGLSSHADYGEILDWLQAFKKPPGKVFLIHGELDACAALKKRIEERFDWEVVIPRDGDEMDL